ncbi:MAG: hypothetical protein PHU23_11905, partial [Dehalococcoidales bacterium]|nr:hypothetical protein [Dehalococcoidales bacterium]
MNIRHWAFLLFALLGNLGVAQASSLQMFFTPSSTAVNVGDSFVVDFGITALDPDVPSDIISAFDVDITFDPTL